MNTVFLGNETAYLDTLRARTDLRCIVAEPTAPEARRVFGSSLTYAERHDIATMSPDAFLAAPPPADLIVSAGFGRRIPGRVIDLPTIGIINIHPSLLPAYRGRHPLNWAIINGERLTGVTIHHVSVHIDEGRIIAQRPVAISADDTILDLHGKTVTVGCALLDQVLDAVGTDAFQGTPQDASNATYFRPRTPADGLIDWQQPAEQIRNLVRALTAPYPGAFFHHRGEKIVVEKATVLQQDVAPNRPGTVTTHNGDLAVQTGRGTLILTECRLPTKPPMASPVPHKAADGIGGPKQSHRWHRRSRTNA